MPAFRTAGLTRIAAVLAVALCLVGCDFFLNSVPTQLRWPTQVKPAVGTDAATLVIHGAYTAPSVFIEGFEPFVRAIDEAGKVVLEAHYTWPDGNMQLPPGRYRVTAYVRSCDANCDQLDPEEPSLSCTVPLDVGPRGTYTIGLTIQDEPPTAVCAISPKAGSFGRTRG